MSYPVLDKPRPAHEQEKVRQKGLLLASKVFFFREGHFATEHFLPALSDLDRLFREYQRSGVSR
jgi:hypothetical protein